MMLSAIIQFLLSAGVIAAAAVVLTTYADVIAARTRLGRLLVGSIFLAAATSLPELTIDLNAIYLGLPDLAVGGLVGSSLFNLLILAIADLADRARGRLFSRTAATHALSGTISITMTAIVGIAIFVEEQVPSINGFRVGVGSMALGLAYLFGMRLVFYDQRVEAEKLEVQEMSQSGWRQTSLRRALVGFLLAAAVIFAVAPWLATSAADIAKLSGLGDTFIGTTLVAFATSLPELVATIAAVRIGATDLAIGNVFGSNAFNVVLIIPMDLAVSGSLLSQVTHTHLLTCMSVCLITSIVILGQLYRVERRILFVEPDAALVIFLTLGSLWLIYLTS